MEWKCKYCQKVLELKTKHTKSGHLAKCIKWKEWKEVNFSKDILYELYVVKEMSLPELQEYFGLDSVTSVWKAIKSHKFKIRSIKEVNSSERIRRKIQDTNMEKYGAKHNFCRESKSRIAWEKRLLEEEGITNVFQRQEVIDRIRETIHERYPDEDPRSFLIRGPKVYSSIHKQIVELLLKENFPIKIEKKILNPILKKTYHFDIHIDNKLIEINGDYWHGNPEIYKATDIILKGSSKEYLVQEKWEKDKQKIEYAQSIGYEVLVIWEKEIKEDIKKVMKKIVAFIEGENFENSKNKEHKEAERKE